MTLADGKQQRLRHAASSRSPWPSFTPAGLTSQLPS
jgi:hypothetical protein